MNDLTYLWHDRTRDGRKVEKVEKTPQRPAGETMRAHVIYGNIEAWYTYFSDGRYLRNQTHVLDLIPITDPYPLDEPQQPPTVATAPTPTPEPGPRVVRFDGPSGPVDIRADRVSAIGQSDVSKSVTWVSLGDKRSDPRGDGDGAEMFWIIGTPDQVAAALWPGAEIVKVGR